MGTDPLAGDPSLLDAILGLAHIAHRSFEFAFEFRFDLGHPLRDLTGQLAPAQRFDDLPLVSEAQQDGQRGVDVVFVDDALASRFLVLAVGPAVGFPVGKPQFLATRTGLVAGDSL
ncbi:MAG TPA: hypothetical protein VM285_06460, partial [Polyangia bacterium]|nr:hypothetical protein [Polyangia bacterium]